MTQSARIVSRVCGWGIVVIGLLITFFPRYSQLGSLWTYDSYFGGPWSADAVATNMVLLVTAAIVAVVGIVMVILSYKLPAKP